MLSITIVNQAILSNIQYYKQIITAHITDNCLHFQVQYYVDVSRDLPLDAAVVLQTCQLK